MSPARKLSLILAALLTLTLAGCGSAGTAAIATQQTSLLTGNWNIVGARTTQIIPTTPLLTTVLIVNGTQITGNGNLLVPCSATSAAGGSLQFSGQLAANGTFQATSNALSSTVVTLTGTAPKSATPATWSGVVTFAPGGTSVTCAYAQSTSFTATPISPLTGTYTGTLTTGINSPHALGTSISMNVTQGPPVALAVGTQTFNQLPLSGTIAIAGSTCFKSGTTTTPNFASQIEGDTPILNFLMDDGSELVIIVDYLSDTTASTIQVKSLTTNGGNCSGGYASTTLTRQ